jgi:hypothetical protein
MFLWLSRGIKDGGVAKREVGGFLPEPASFVLYRK